jgi:hypothetical protein
LDKNSFESKSELCIATDVLAECTCNPDSNLL